MYVARRWGDCRRDCIIQDFIIGLDHVITYLDDVVAFDPDPSTYWYSPNEHEGDFPALAGVSRREYLPPLRLKSLPQRVLIPAGLFVKILRLFF